jgi:[ribosomal protein S18]-alanine N-acetyltransferase
MDTQDIPFHVCAMTVRDVAEVAALEQQVFTCPWSIHAFRYEVQQNPMAHFAVVRPRQPARQTPEAGGPVQRLLHRSSSGTSSTPLLGYGGLWLIVDEGHICTLAVHPECRGKGLGDLLLQYLLEQAVLREATVATLEVRVTNHVAQRLYRKYTFTEVGLRKGYYQDDHEDAIIMTTALLSSVEFQTAFQANKAALSLKLVPESN